MQTHTAIKARFIWCKVCLVISLLCTCETNLLTGIFLVSTTLQEYHYLSKRKEFTLSPPVYPSSCLLTKFCVTAITPMQFHETCHLTWVRSSLSVKLHQHEYSEQYSLHATQIYDMRTSYELRYSEWLSDLLSVLFSYYSNHL